MRKPLLFFLFCLVSLSHAAQTPSRWRFEFNYGQVNTTYFERIEGTAADVQVEQKSDWSEVVLQYFLAPPYFELTFAGQFTGANIDEPEDETQQIQIATGIANLGWVLPAFSEYFLLKLNLERFYTTTYVKDDAFGFRNLVGWQIYPEFEWMAFGTDAFLKVNTFFKVPLWTDTGNRQEFTAGLKLRIPFFGGAKRFPVYAYKSALIFKVFYSKLKLKFANPGFRGGNVEIEQVGASVGLNF